MTIPNRFRSVKRLLQKLVYIGSGTFIIVYPVYRTVDRISKIVNTSVLDREKKYSPEYIYIDDPNYDATLKMEQDKESRSKFRSIGVLRFWKSLRHSLAWRLLWLCRHGNKEQRNIALDQLAAFKDNKKWDCLKLAQAMDEQTAVLLARTQGADLRYFLEPPLHVRRAALTHELLSFKFRDMIHAVQKEHPHSCIQLFLTKCFGNVQDHATEVDNIPAKPDYIIERDLCLQCLDAIHHHINLFYDRNFNDDRSSQILIEMQLLPRLAESMIRYRNDPDLHYAVVRILTVLSVHKELLKDFFQNGLIRELSRLIRSNDVRLASSAAVCLANLSGECCYLPGLYLLHPLYRTKANHVCDTLLVHGLRGSVFVTWRQRDKKCFQPIGIIEVTISEMDCDPCPESHSSNFLDPEIKQVIDDLEQLEEESLLSDYEVVLHDIPIKADRDDYNIPLTANNKHAALTQEYNDKCNYTFCWPKDWLPKDCENLRILGVNYWSSLSEWLERCPLQTAEVSVRAQELAPALIAADVGTKDVPVVWLAHSMGGLIVKQMLVDAAKSDDLKVQQFCYNTKAVIFYSTPHKGSSLAAMPRAAAAILWPSTDVRQLQENHPVLLELDKAFIKYADFYNWETISFVETMPTLVTAFKVPINFVEIASADIGRGVLYQLPLDHLSICKPTTRESVLYTTALNVVQRVTERTEMLAFTESLWQQFLTWLWWIFGISRSFNADVSTRVDEVEANDKLKWVERMLLQTFTDF